MKRELAAALSLGIGVLACNACAQQQGGFNPGAMAREALAEPFVGITSDGTPRSGLYEIEQTGVSTQPVIEAARDLLASLTEEQRNQMLFPVDSLEWRNWANIHRFERQGVSLQEMNEERRGYAYAFPDLHWRWLRTNNPLERIIREIRRRTRMVGAFPDGRSIWPPHASATSPGSAGRPAATST